MHASSTLSVQHPSHRTIQLGSSELASIAPFMLFPTLLDLLISPFNFTNFRKQIMPKQFAPLNRMQIYRMQYVNTCVFMYISIGIHIRIHVYVCVCMQICKYSLC